MSSGLLRHLFAAYAVLFFSVLAHHISSAARNINGNCAPSSCGNIHNISYPFRLKTDPENCGNKNYELECENSRAMLYLNTARYYVQAINYNNFTIRLVDADFQKDNCSSVPRHSFPSRGENAYGPEYNTYNIYPDGGRICQKDLVFMTCADRIRSPLYVDTSSCNDDGTHNSTTSISSPPHLKGGYSYVFIGGKISGIMDSCHIESMVSSACLFGDWSNIPYKTIHDSLAYGFELSWFPACCEFFEENRCEVHDPRILTSNCDAQASRAPIRVFLRFLTDGILSNVAVCIPNHKVRGRMSYSTSGKPRFTLYITETKSPYEESEWSISSSSLFISLIILLITLLIIIVLYRALLLFCGVVCLINLLIYKWRRRHLSMYDNIEQFLQSHDNLMPVRYSYPEIKKITRGFKDKLGEGGYGSVYKGKLRSGRFAAVKMLSKSKANGQEFMNEVATIGRIHHVNVVQLIGFSVEGSKRALIYEFMPNGSLDKYIFSRESSIALSNKKMFEISLGIARGIEYLHRGCDMQILHFDIKPHNILLDENFLPKVSDFGLAKLYPTNNSIVSLTAARGTLGYMAPELFYRSIGGVSYKADVYSFGMLLMEMVGRRKNFNKFAEHSSQIYFPPWIHDQFSEGKDIELGDVTEQEKKTTKKMIIVALWCIQLKPNDRPSMLRVIEMLEAEVESLQMPPRPFFTPRDMPEEDARVEIANPTRFSDPPDHTLDSSYQLGR